MSRLGLSPWNTKGLHGLNRQLLNVVVFEIFNKILSLKRYALIFHRSLSSTANDVHFQFGSKVAEMIPQKVVGHRSLNIFASKSQFGIAD
jgi:hypothetical protein